MKFFDENYSQEIPTRIKCLRKKRKDVQRVLKCPYCNEADTKVIDSRPADDNSSIRRRRQCERCGKRFTTYEKLETMPLMVIKKDESRETYDRSKIEAGIIHSCHKRPVSTQQINTVIDEIENQIFNMEEKKYLPLSSASWSWRSLRCWMKWHMCVLLPCTESLRT